MKSSVSSILTDRSVVSQVSNSYQHSSSKNNLFSSFMEPKTNKHSMVSSFGFGDHLDIDSFKNRNEKATCELRKYNQIARVTSFKATNEKMMKHKQSERMIKRVKGISTIASQIKP